MRLSSLSVHDADAHLVAESMALIDACTAVGVKLPSAATKQLAIALMPIHTMTAVALQREQIVSQQCTEFIQDTCEQIVLHYNRVN